MIRSDGVNDPQSGVLHEERIIRNPDYAVLSHTVTEPRRFGFGDSALIPKNYHAELSFDEDWIVDWRAAIPCRMRRDRRARLTRLRIAFFFNPYSLNPYSLGRFRRLSPNFLPVADRYQRCLLA